MSNENELRKQVHAMDAEVRTPPHHDATILANARIAAERIKARGPKKSAPKRTWFVPLSLAASFIIGMVAMRLMDAMDLGSPGTAPVALTIPVDATRGGAGGSIPVEKASPEDWYRYIQELTAAGEAREAQQHLERFNELHPDFAYQP